MLPFVPSTLTKSPSLIISVSPGIPNTAGMPYILANAIEFADRPPFSVIIAFALSIIVTSLGVAVLETTIEPSFTLGKSSSFVITIALPIANPDDAAIPYLVSPLKSVTDTFVP